MSSSSESELIHRNQTRKAISDQPSSSSSFSFSTCQPKPTTNTNPIGHMLRHRAPFLLMGIAIAALFFHAFPLAESESTLPTRRVLLEEPTNTNTNMKKKEEGGVTRVPVGLGGKRRRRIVVTGGAGFVGSHLVDRLIERGDSVIVLDNMFTGRKDNLLHHLGNPNFELIRHDVVQPILLEVDQIYHLACPASPVHYKFNPVKTIISFLSSFLFTLLI